MRIRRTYRTSPDTASRSWVRHRAGWPDDPHSPSTESTHRPRATGQQSRRSGPVLSRSRRSSWMWPGWSEKDSDLLRGDLLDPLMDKFKHVLLHAIPGEGNLGLGVARRHPLQRAARSKPQNLSGPRPPTASLMVEKHQTLDQPGLNLNRLGVRRPKVAPPAQSPTFRPCKSRPPGPKASPIPFPPIHCCFLPHDKAVECLLRCGCTSGLLSYDYPD